MSLTLLQPLQVPRPPRPEDIGADPKAAVEGLHRWAATLSSVLNTFIQQVQEVGEAFITAPSSANLDTGVIQGYQLIVTSALITVAAQIQDAIITNAKVVSLTSDKVYLGNTGGNTLTTSGSTLILPGLLQISAPDSGALSLYVKGTADGTQDTGARSLRINGVEQYSTAQGVSQALSFTAIATSGTAGTTTVYVTNNTPTSRTDLANAILAASPSALIVISSYVGPGSATFDFLGAGQDAKNLGSALLGMGIDIGSLEGIVVTGGNGGFKGRIPFVGLGFNGGGAGSGITIYTNGSSNAGAAVYQGFLLGNKPGSGAQFSKTTIIEGGAIRVATVTADRLTVSQLSAIAGDMGTLNAGTINGGQIISGATSGAYTKMGPSGVQVFDAGGNVVASLSSATNSLIIASGGSMLLQAISGSPAELIFQTSDGRKIARLTGFTAVGHDNLSLQSDVDATGWLLIGKSAQAWAGQWQYANSSLNMNVLAPGGGAVIQRLVLNTAQTLIGSPTAYLNLSSSEITANADFRPVTNNTANLGNANARWAQLWVGSGFINTIGAAAQTSAVSTAVTTVSFPTAGNATLSVIIDGGQYRIPLYGQG